jgi:hypothetical protein
VPEPPPRKTSQPEFEASIADDQTEGRNELHVEQITPPHDIDREAFVTLRPDTLARAHEVHDGLSEGVQY